MSLITSEPLPAAQTQNRTPLADSRSITSEPEPEPEPIYSTSVNFKTSPNSGVESRFPQAADTVCESSASPSEDSHKEGFPERHSYHKYRTLHITKPVHDSSLPSYRSPHPRSYDFKLVTAESPCPACPMESSSERENSQTESIDPTIADLNGQEYSVLFSESAIWERIVGTQNPTPLFTRPFEAPEQRKRKWLPESHNQEEGNTRKRHRRIPSANILPSWATDVSDVIDETDALESDTDISDTDDANTLNGSESSKGYRLSTESVFPIRNVSSRLTSASYTRLTEGQSQISETSENDTLRMLSNIPSRPDLDHTATQESHSAHTFETPTETYPPQPLEQEVFADLGSLGILKEFNENSGPYLEDNYDEIHAEIDNDADVDVDAHNHYENYRLQAPQSTEENSHILGNLPVSYTQQDETNEDIASKEETETNKSIDYSGFIFPMTTTPYVQNVARCSGYNADSHKDIRRELFPTQTLCQIIRRRYTRHDVSILQGHDPKYVYDTNKQFKESKPYQYEFVRIEFIPGTQTLDRSTRCASCAYCEKLQFYNLKNSHYLFHMAHIHGISSDNYLYPDGIEAGIYRVTNTRVSTGSHNTTAKTTAKTTTKTTTKDRPCVLCPKCFQVCPTHTSKTTRKKAPLANYQRHFKDKHQRKSKRDDFYNESVWYPSGQI